MLLKIWSPPGDWRLQDGPAVSQKHCVVRKSLFLVQSLGCCKQGVGFSSVVCWLLPCSYRLPDGSAIGEPNENSTSAIFCCLFCWPICVSSCPGGWQVGNTKAFQSQWPQLFICGGPWLGCLGCLGWWLEFLLASPHSFEAFPVVGSMLMRRSCVSCEFLNCEKSWHGQQKGMANASKSLQFEMQVHLSLLI